MRRRVQTTACGALIALAAIAVLVLIAVQTRDEPTTVIGEAAVALGDDTARVVESVTYRQSVERVGDVVLADGAPVAGTVMSEEIGAVWDLVDSLWPSSLRDQLAQLSVVREAPRGLVGVVHPSATGGWILSLDVADMEDPALVQATIVHELSHVITLDPSVFTFGDVENCSGAATSLGCAETGSLLADFAQRFWPRDIASVELSTFVNDYASTAAHEDVAETFTAWVLSWPVESPVVEAKIDMLATDRELVRLAADLRLRLFDLNDVADDSTGGAERP